MQETVGQEELCLSDAADALRRLSLLTTLTVEEQARLDFLERAPENVPARP